MRIRTIKPEFWAHPILARLDNGARLAAVGLLNIADDEGFFFADPAIIRSSIWPFDECSSNARRALETLIQSGYCEVKKHPTHGMVGLVVGFTKHQRIDRPSPSKIRTYFLDERSTNDPRTLDERSPLEQGSGNREQGSGNKGREARARDSVNGSEVSPEESKAKGYHPDTRFILHKLNQLTGKNFRECDSSLFPISARLKEPGVDKNAVVAMLERMAAIWKGTEMAEYLRPATLFNKTKFEAYYASRNQPITRRHNQNSALGADEFSVSGRDQRIADYAKLDRLEAEKLAAGELDDPWAVYGPKPGQVGDLAQKGAPNGRARSEGAENGDMGRVSSPPDGPL